MARRSPPPSQVKGSGFVPLTQARQIPVGSILDTTGGTVAITAASATKGVDYTGQITGGVFRLLQHRQQKGLTELDLMDTLSRAVCASTGKGPNAAAAVRRLSRKVLGLLKSTDHGKFSTRGAYSSASVRGTAYSVADTCAGTLTKVSRGVVVVDYFRRHKRLVVRAGQSFLALRVRRAERRCDDGQGIGRRRDARGNGGAPRSTPIGSAADGRCRQAGRTATSALANALGARSIGATGRPGSRAPHAERVRLSARARSVATRLVG